MELAQGGDQEAFAEIAHAINSRLFTVAHRILRDYHLAEDATQQAIVLIWRDLPKLIDLDRFGSWSYRIVVNVCYRQAQRGRRAAEGLHLLRRDESTAPAEAAVVARDMVERAFVRLKPEHRALLVLQYYVELGSAEIADVLGIPVGTVKSRSASARNALRAALDADARPGVARRTA